MIGGPHAHAQLISCDRKPSPHLTNLPSPPAPPHHLHLHYPAKLSQLAGDVSDQDRVTEAERMWAFLERVNWADPSLVFPSGTVCM